MYIYIYKEKKLAKEVEKSRHGRSEPTYTKVQGREGYNDDGGSQADREWRDKEGATVGE